MIQLQLNDLRTVGQVVPNSVIQGDCLEAMKYIADKSIDAIICDLPYGTTACKWDSVIPFGPLWAQYERVIKDNGAIVLTASQPFTSALVMSNTRLFKYEWIWDKKRITNPILCNIRPLNQHENVMVFYKKQPTYNPQPFIKNTTGHFSGKGFGEFHVVETDAKAKLKKGSNDREQGFPRSLLVQIPVMNNLSVDKSGLHPTQKPVALMEYLIKTYTNEGDTVLDNCYGSATTGIACLNTNRQFIGIEKDETYFRLGVDRMRKHADARAYELNYAPTP